MAFSAEDKARIKQRAQEIIDAEGISAGEAAQRAIGELFSFEEIQKAFRAPTQTIEQQFDVEAPPRTADIEGLDLQLEQQASRYETERMRELERSGMTRQEARTIVNQELESVRRPVPLGFGTVEEREERAFGIGPIGRETPIPGQEEAPITVPSGILYDEIQTVFEEQAGLDRPEASDQTQAFRDFIVEPRRRNLISQGIPPQEADERALKESFDVLSDLNIRLTDESTYEQPEEEQSGDQWIRAFSRQAQRGPGVPQLTEEQRNYLNATIDAQIERETDRILEEETPTTDLYSGDFRPLTRDEVRQQVIDSEPRPWWLTEDADLVRLNPDEYDSSGFFTRTTPYGTQKETLGGWMLRAALSPFNAFAGTMSYLAYDVPEIVPGREQARKEKGFEGELGSAILLNVAENRGFTGEAMEAADLAQLGGAARIATIAGGVAADLLDPSVDIVKALGVTGKSGIQAYRATGELYQGLSRRGSQALGTAARIGARDFLDSNLIGTLVGKRFDAGDVRGVITRNLADDYSAAIVAQQNRNKSVADILKLLDGNSPDVPKLDNTNFARRLRAELEKKPEISTGEALDNIGNFFKDTTLDDLARLAEAQGVRRRDLARTVGALASADETIRTFLRAVEVPRRTPKINAYVDALMGSEYKNLFLRTLAADKAARDVIDATKGIDAFDNLVAVTQNTYAGKGSAKQILERAKESPLGRIVEELADQKELELVSTADRARAGIGQRLTTGLEAELSAPRIQPAYKLEADQVARLKEIVNDLQTFGKLPKEITMPMIVRLDKNIITVSDLRQLIDANVDLIAEGLVATKGLKGVTRARDLSRLPTGEQIDLLQPLESRTFARPFLRRLRESLIGAKKIQGNLSVAQRQLLRRAEADAAALDQRLVRLLKLAMEDPAVRTAYDIPDGATRQEILGHLIVGPKESLLAEGIGPAADAFRSLGIKDVRQIKRSRDRIKNLLIGSLNDLFFSKETKENIFDVLTGTHVTTNGSVFTPRTFEILEDALNNSARLINENPARFFDELYKIAEQANQIVRDGSPALIRGKADDITYVLDTSKKNLLSRLGDKISSPGKIPAEAQIAAYYRAEADRIVDDLLSQLVTKEIGKGELSIDNMFNDEFLRAYRQQIIQTIRSITLDIDETVNIPIENIFNNQSFRNLIQNQIKRILKGDNPGVPTREDFKNIIMEATPDSQKEAVERFFINEAVPGGTGARGAAAARAARRGGISRIQGLENRLNRFLEPIVESAEDIAKGIIRRNNFTNADVDIARIDKLFSDITSSNNYASDLRLLFGEDVAAQLQDEFLQGYQSIRDELLQLQNRQYETGFTAGTARTLRAAYEALSNAVYTILLNFRPRFHGANLLTGADIAYSTTGRIVNPRDLGEALSVMGYGLKGGGPIKPLSPGRIMFRDPGGRAYTAGELRQILEDVTGRSVFGLNLPQAGSKRLRNLLNIQDDTASIENFGRKALEFYREFKELPQVEDLMFRYAILKRALQEGRTLDEAIALAKRSMFDSGEITKAERQIKNIALFYGFMRNNLVNTIRNLSSLKGLKRTAKVARLRDITSKLLTDEQTNQSSPSYAQTRMLLGKIGWKPEEGRDILLTSPSLATLDGVYTLADLIKLEAAGVIGGSLRPEYKEIFGVEDSFDREFKKVPPEHIAFLNQFGFDPIDVINTIITVFGATPIVPTPGKTEDGAVNGLIYNLDTPQQRRAYKKFHDIMAFTGATTLRSDFARTIAPEGTKTGEVIAQTGPIGSIAAQLGYTVGGVTPMTYTSPERQAYYDRLSRLRTLQQMVRDTEAREEVRFGQELTPQERARGERREERAQEYDERRQRRITRLEDLEREIRIIKERRYSILRAYNAASRRGDRDEALRLRAENNDLKARQRELEAQRDQMAIQEEQ